MKGFLFACAGGAYTAVSWIAAGTMTGIDPTTAMKLLLHGSGGGQAWLSLGLFVVMSLVMWVIFWKIYNKKTGK